LDITERKLAEQALYKSEERFRKLFERHAAVKILLDPDTGNIIDANHAASDFYGWSIEELRQMSIQQINSISPDIIKSNFEKIRTSQQNRFSFRHNMADGSVREVEVFCNTIEIEDEEVLYAIIHDITERKRYESLVAFRLHLLEIAETDSIEIMLNLTLAEAERMTESQIGFCHFIADDQTTISKQAWSDNTRKEMSRANQSGTDMRMNEIDLYTDVLRERRAVIYNDENWLNSPDGDIEVKSALVVPVIRGNRIVAIFGVGNKSGKYDDEDIKVISSLVDIAWDIVSRKRSELLERDTRESLIHSQKMELIGQLAGGIAHDFNNMLGVIIGNVEMAMERHTAAEPMLENLRDILKATERSANLTRQLLAFARKEPLMPIILDLSNLVERSITMIRRLIGENIAVVWMPDSHSTLVKVDPSQVDQILVNLCINARDAISGIGRITIETGIIIIDKTDSSTDSPYRIPGEYVTLSVTDDGCGIEKEHLLHIFEPFFTTKEQDKGTGLGLSTVYGIVKQNNGFIDYRSELNKGTTFTIYLPRHRGYPGPEPDEIDQQEPPLKRGKETILIVEDEPEILHLSRRMLEHKGYLVLSASKPYEAIRIAEKHNGCIDLLLTDVVMPGMNGSDLSKKLKSSMPHLKTLFMSGYTTDIVSPLHELYGRINFIQKPFSFKSLMMNVQDILQQDKF
jgi:PAS domain S-box-containing protein